jgi:hypothetical protein
MKARWLAFFLVLLMPCLCRADDTGTYRIDDYQVRLTPHADGMVTVEYYQKWAVTGGHIPWITVGVPNSSFVVKEHSGAARGLSNGSNGGWSGVRVDLDKDYMPGESFEVRFSIEQSGLFHAAGTNLTLDFTPGWYDRAGIGRLTVIMNIAAQASEVKASPSPTKVEGQEITWVRQNLGAGEQVQFSAAFPKARMPSVVATEGSHAGHGIPISPGTIFIIIVVIIVVFNTMRWMSKRGGGYSHGGTIFYGGRGGGGFGGSGSSSRSSSGGGGFGGSSSSCACACVSCACACACAGGGGAGCSKKATHTCPLCRDRRGVVQ